METNVHSVLSHKCFMGVVSGTQNSVSHQKNIYKAFIMSGIVVGACGSMEEVGLSSGIQEALRLLLGWVRECWSGRGGVEQA